MICQIVLILAQNRSTYKGALQLARVSISRKYGFIDKQGNVLIPIQYDIVSDFENGIARVGIATGEKRSNIYDERNWLVIIPYFDGKFGVINKKGDYLIPPTISAPDEHFNSDNRNFKEGLAPFQEKGKYGFINLLGKVIVPAIYDYVYGFSEGLAMIRSGNKNGYINTKGTVVIEPNFAGAFNFHEGLGAVQKKISLIDSKSGKKKSGLKWGYINSKGEIIIEPKFSAVSEFHDGLALVLDNDKYAYIDRTGKEIWREK